MRFVNPVLTGVQFVPPLLETKTPSPLVPANRVVPRTARARTMVLVNPLLTLDQLFASSVERYTPAPFVPANSVFPIRAREKTTAFASRPVLRAVHAGAPSVNR